MALAGERAHQGGARVRRLSHHRAVGADRRALHHKVRGKWRCRVLQAALLSSNTPWPTTPANWLKKKNRWKGEGFCTALSLLKVLKRIWRETQNEKIWC